ncbi:hypothetical protein [Rathayibacter sp. AY1D3]|uniref:hypothetical protein n=1 Tax=Rathayibacter sp. AY1D3 TaxID=2080544 RepID=UPI0011B09160|nr:hypothetical protein [Rathayibacter sp. AY1D3]
MRTLVRLEFRREGDAPVITEDGVEEVLARVHASIWYPEEQLSTQQLGRLLLLARTTDRDAEGLRHSEAAAMIENDDQLPLHPHLELLAINVLVLLTQIKHDILLNSLDADRIIPLHDGSSGCWGLVTVFRNRVNVRVRSESIDRLEAATERALVALRVVAANDRSIRRGLASDQVALVPTGEDVLEVAKDGTESRTGRVHVLGRVGRLRYSLTQPAPIWLISISLALLLGSGAMQFFEATGNTDSWFTWSHSLIDKILTTAFWTTALVVVQAFRSLGRHPRMGGSGTRIYIAWKRP